MEKSFGLVPNRAPMEARSAKTLPDEMGKWQYEPKWDGFRCLVFKEESAAELRGKSGKALGRFFPEVIALLRDLPVERFVADGELVIEIDGRLSFDALQMRLHPAESRIRKLAAETPARLVLFDMLISSDGEDMTGAPFAERRRALEAFGKRAMRPGRLLITPFTREIAEAKSWLAGYGGTDGVVAKRLDRPYESGERAMVKVKRLRTADCVVGGFRYESHSREVGSLLLGLYDADGKLDHVGFTAAISRTAGADPQAGGASRAARLHGKNARRPEPLEHRAQRRMGAAEAGTGGRGAVRPRHWRPVPAWNAPTALAPGQGSPAMYDGADRAVASEELASDRLYWDVRKRARRPQ